MNSMVGQALQYRRLRAPRDNGATLIDPAAEGVGELIARNAQIVRQSDYDVQGRTLADLAASARKQLVDEALAYTRTYRSVDDLQPRADSPILLAGHQPQLFHPGVWFKNFVLGSLAAQHEAVPINLVIDSDTIKSALLRVPGGNAANPLLEPIDFDRPSAEIPFEERMIVDRELFASFGRRAYDVVRPLVPEAMLPQFWPLVTDRARHVRNLGECLAQARHQQEGRWGSTTLELPQSHVCQIEAFHWFTAHLLARLPRLWETYNSAVAEYRRINHVRSAAHPVPNLAAADDWLEAPFWIWRAECPRRRQLFARQRGDEIVLSDRHGLEIPLPLTPEGDGAAAVARLHELQERGIRIRTRALITTLFARVFLGDVFLHGIGGAKYDQVTDLLMSRFFGLEPTGYMTVTATLRLPVPHAIANAGELRRLTDEQREIAFHPERVLEKQAAPRQHTPPTSGSPSTSSLDVLVALKRQWIETPPTKANARQRCRAIRGANEQMQAWLADDAQRLARERLAMVERLRYEAVLASREYAFCFFPADALRELFAQA